MLNVKPEASNTVFEIPINIEGDFLKDKHNKKGTKKNEAKYNRMQSQWIDG
jgi:hypothetical protein